MMSEYIHYGNTEFDAKRMFPITNAYFTKPNGGFWASPVDAQYGWKQWCEDENFRECCEENSFRFHLKDNANVVHIMSSDDLEELPKQKKVFPGWVMLDYEEICRHGIDAIELHLSEEKKPKKGGMSLHRALYGWDCDSILILNPDIVVT